MLFRSFAITAIISFGFLGPAALAADDSAKQPQAAGQSAPAPTGDAGAESPAATAESAAKGELKSPYSDFAKVADEGHKKFMAAGCHGGGGGGGMGPPLTNQVWVYGKDDDTLFRLVALGSDGLKKQGYSRKGSENVVGPMPAMGGVVKSDDDLWKIIAWSGLGRDRPATSIAGLIPTLLALQ